MKKLRIIIADDHAVVRQGLKKIIARTNDIKVVGEAGDPRELAKTLAKTPCDVLLLDITMPGSDIIKDLKRIKRTCPGLPVLILSMHPEDQYGVRTLKAGAAGYVTKVTAPEDLVKAIRQVAGGRKYISAGLAEKLVENLNPKRRLDTADALSAREEQVLRKIAEGRNSKQIAAALCISDKTISTYRRRIKEKLGITNSAELVRYAFEKGIID